jgi:GPH family glycoside/pentoside/hexuronide:cation symporter
MEIVRERLPFRIKIAYGIGELGELVFLGMFNTFIVIFYNQAIGLSNSLIGTAIMLAMIGDAISDPLVGMLSDRWRSRLGRRHPFLFAAPIPLAISLFFIFSPPELLTGGAAGEPNQMGLFAWLAVWTISARLFVTLYTIPHHALGAELTKDPHERSQLFSLNAIIGHVSGALFSLTVWGFFFAGESVLADGSVVPKHLDPLAYPPVVLTACGIVLVMIYLSSLGTLGRVPYLSSPPENQARMSFPGFYRELIGIFVNPNYKFLMIGFFVLAISIGLSETLTVFVITYFWELKPEQIKWFGLVLIPAIIIGASASPALMRKFDRKPVLIAGLTGVVVLAQLPVCLRLLGLMPVNGSELLLPILLVNALLSTMCAAAGAVAMMSMLGDITDENELLIGRRQEGLIYSARAFFAKASNSVAHFVGGIMMDLYVVFPFDAVPGEVDSDVIWRLGLLDGPVICIAGLCALPFYARYRLTRARHREILNELERNPQHGKKTEDAGPKIDLTPVPISEH